MGRGKHCELKSMSSSKETTRGTRRPLQCANGNGCQKANESRREQRITEALESPIRMVSLSKSSIEVVRTSFAACQR